MMVIIDDHDDDDDDADDEDDDDGGDDDDGDDTLVSILDHNRCRPYFYIRFKRSVKADWSCRRCIVMIVIVTLGDAEDAR